jgi:hypothetical protein
VVNSSQGGGSKDTWVTGGYSAVSAAPAIAVASPLNAGPPMDIGPDHEDQGRNQQQ